MPRAGEPPAAGLHGLLLDIGGVMHRSAIDTARELLGLPPRRPGHNY
jgi:hypothetical protein